MRDERTGALAAMVMVGLIWLTSACLMIALLIAAIRWLWNAGGAS